MAVAPPTASLAQDLEQTKKNLIDKEEREREVMASLFHINQKMKKMVSEQGTLVQQRLSLEAQSQELAAKIVALEEQLKSHKSLLRERLAAIYKMGGQGVTRLIFSSTSSEQIEKNLKILGIISKRDLDLVKDYTSTMKELGLKKTKLQNRLAKIHGLENKIQIQEKSLAQDNTEKMRLLETIKTSQASTLNKLEKLRKKTAALQNPENDAAMDLLYRPSFFEQKSTLPWPLQTGEIKVAQKFGVIHDEEHNLNLPQKGLLLATAQATAVHSVFEGSVAYAGPLDGYGPTVIIDHGDHYYTVYAGNSALQVKKGDEVAKNQVIALSGIYPERGIEALYFEVRHFSEPNDPKSWLKGIHL